MAVTFALGDNRGHRRDAYDTLGSVTCVLISTDTGTGTDHSSNNDQVRPW